MSFKDLERVIPAAVRTEYTMMPRRFVGIDSWPKKSNLRCWYCGIVPTDYPKFIAKNPCRGPMGDECDTYGHFHTWNCAQKFIETEMPAEERWDLSRALCLFEAKFTGKLRRRIVAAPPRYLMSAYCGSTGITQDEYDEKITETNAKMQL